MRIGIIGHFGGKEKFNDGQTVKTIAIYDALKRYGFEDVDKIDTYYIKKNPFVFMAQFLSGLFGDKKYIVLLSSNGRKVLFPILCFMSRYMNKEVYHYGIGGRLAREVSEKPKWKKYILSFKSNWMESIELADQLQKLGVRNAIYLPNFKKLNILKESALCMEYSAPYKFCTFSRVMKEKGIEDAIDAIRTINSDYGKTIVTLDIYGPAEESYLSHLKEILKNNDMCAYRGVVPANESVEALKDYYGLLFPTHWKHEGIPGTIIDALSAGVPVIARRWQYCDEILQHKVTGYIYDFDKPDKLKDTIIYAVEHVEETVRMKKACIERAYDYSEDYVIQYVARQMNIER